MSITQNQYNSSNYNVFQNISLINTTNINSENLENNKKNINDNNNDYFCLAFNYLYDKQIDNVDLDDQEYNNNGNESENIYLDNNNNNY